ncbi:hypothetical protein IU470_26620 [Nocardia abscessus]|uniref:Uncharacterized protein n=1 Tax=Nocardia abscessus TaxID=120957 RepID=A0ABS0CE85_9NOCA|nr:hypothetical protein [Nocardia abscessus]MBF6228668.1 hypothetical protein [Nocardia abscessus]
MADILLAMQGSAANDAELLDAEAQIIGEPLLAKSVQPTPNAGCANWPN